MATWEEKPGMRLSRGGNERVFGGVFGEGVGMVEGAGLLAMTAAHLWPEAVVLAADIAPSAVDITRRNIVHNGLQERIRVLRSDGYRHKDIAAAAPFDLVLCNMTADILLPLAAGLRAVLAEDGIAVLSGVLRWRSQEVLAMHAHLGLVEAATPLGLEVWDAHILVKSARA